MKEKTIGEALGITKEIEKKLISSIRETVARGDEQNIASIIEDLCEEEDLDKKSVLAGWYLLLVTKELIETTERIVLYNDSDEQIEKLEFIPI